MPAARSFPAETVASAARMARLELPPERAALVGGLAEAIYAQIDRLDDVPLGETPPATAFDARWSDAPRSDAPSSEARREA